MSRNVPVAEATRDEVVLPERVQEALGELVGAAQEGLLALSVGVGLGVLTELMEEEVDDVVGPKGQHNAERAAVRHGHEDGSVTLGGRRVDVKRPRVRTADGEAEVPLRTYEHFADRDLLISMHTASLRYNKAMSETFLTVAEVAELLKLNPQTVRNWIDQGRLPASRAGRRGR